MKVVVNRLMKGARVFFLGAAVLMITVSMAGASATMPQFSLSSAIGGKTIQSIDFKGKALLVTFFATWCPPCRQEISALKQLQNEYGPRGFSVIGLSVDENGPKVVAKLIKKEKINYPVLMSERSTARDFGGIAGIPTSFLVNKEGNVVKRYPGYIAHSLLARDIQMILE